jgi:hypothetical protein
MGIIAQACWRGVCKSAIVVSLGSILLFFGCDGSRGVEREQPSQSTNSGESTLGQQKESETLSDGSFGEPTVSRGPIIATVEANLDGEGRPDQLVFVGNAEPNLRDETTEDLDHVVAHLRTESSETVIELANLWTFGYRAKEAAILSAFAEKVHSPHPYFPIADINGNGRDEIFLWNIGGSGSGISPTEYRGGDFPWLISDTGGIEIVTGLELVGNIENCPCGYRVYGIGRAPGVPPGMRNWVEYAWSQEVQLYVIVDEGVEEWEGDWFSED